MSNSNDDHIRINIRPMFLSTLGMWDKKNRIYAKTLPNMAFNQCKNTCDTFFSMNTDFGRSSDDIPEQSFASKNKKGCNQFCNQLYSQYVADSEALIVAKTFCKPSDGASKTSIECLHSNKTKIIKGIDKLCGTDDVCTINNKDIFNMMLSNTLGGDVDNQSHVSTSSKHRQHGKNKVRSNFKKDTQASSMVGVNISTILITLLFIGILVSIIIFSN